MNKQAHTVHWYHARWIENGTEQKRYCTILFSYNGIYWEKPSKSAKECCWD